MIIIIMHDNHIQPSHAIMVGFCYHGMTCQEVHEMLVYWPELPCRQHMDASSTTWHMLCIMGPAFEPGLNHNSMVVDSTFIRPHARPPCGAYHVLPDFLPDSPLLWSQQGIQSESIVGSGRERGHRCSLREVLVMSQT